jgi:hypothetical protein
MNRKQEKTRTLTVNLETSSRTQDVKELIIDTLGAALRTGDSPGETTITAKFKYRKSAEKALNRVMQILQEESTAADVNLTEE